MREQLRRYWQQPVVAYLWAQLREQLLAIVPLVIFIFAFVGIFFQRLLPDAGPVIGGLALVSLGLLFFLEGLKFFFVPMGFLIGTRLPQKYSTPIVLLVGGLLGVLVTYAEPAIASFVPLGVLVKKVSAPYLFLMMNQYRELMVFMIAIGVGIAAVLGVARFMYQIALKWLILICGLPTFALSFYMMFGNDKLRENVAMAWDCGAITTGSVTTPILLSLGLGVSRQRGTENAVAGFGIVTLASLLPIFMVQLLSVILSGAVDKAGIDRARSTSDSAIDKPPLQPLVSGLRAILPLSVFLVLVVKLVLRSPLPHVKWPPPKESEPGRAQEGVAALEPSDESRTSTESEPQSQPQHNTSKLPWMLIIMYLCAQIGIIVFNFGLSYGLVVLGEHAGEMLPAAIVHTPWYLHSPHFSHSAGMFVVGLFGFCIGILATLAEPALRIMGLKAAEVTNGRFGGRPLVFSVAIGVGFGTMVGLYRVILGTNILWILLPCYTVAFLLSLPCSDEVMAIAWDCGAVTTGDVTVPFVLSLGLHIAQQTGGHSDGWGILACASISPILAVLLTYHATLGIAWVRERWVPLFPDKNGGSRAPAANLSGNGNVENLYL